MQRIPQALAEHGYLLEKSQSADEVRALLDDLGEVIFKTDVTVVPESRPLVTSARALDFHTDHSRADYVVWHCLRQASEGGITLLVDAEAVIAKLPPELQKDLEKISLFEHEVFANDPKSCPLVTWRDGRRLFYFSLWLVNTADRDHPAMQAFRDAIQSTDRIEVLLKPGDVLIIDNRRMFHGRTAIEGNKDRLLKRYWLRKGKLL